jgi:hypothetical protein
MKKYLFALIVLGLGFASVAYANPLFFVSSAQTATATSTLTFMTPGTATTTLYFDSSVGAPGKAVDKAVLLTQLTASSTNTKLNIGVEYSNGVAGTDCTLVPTACDWYADEQQNSVTATTSQAYQIGTPITYSWTYASTTQGGAAVGNSNIGLKVITLPMPTRYTRVFYSLGIGGTNGAVWGQIIPQRQTN